MWCALVATILLEDRAMHEHEDWRVEVSIAVSAFLQFHSHGSWILRSNRRRELEEDRLRSVVGQIAFRSLSI